MLEYICSIILLIVIFFMFSFILVKLYEHGVRSWFIQSIVSVAVFAYFFGHPSVIHSDIEKWIALDIVLACIFVVDKPYPSTKKAKTKPQIHHLTENTQVKHSYFQTFLDAILLYSIWSYFTDDDVDDDFL